MNFIVRNEFFICKFCGAKNPPAKKTCRNHCRKCLFSLHVDEIFPGDRASDCCGKMIPAEICGTIDDLKILHVCEKCDKKIQNKIAADDDFSQILKIQQKKSDS